MPTAAVMAESASAVEKSGAFTAPPLERGGQEVNHCLGGQREVADHLSAPHPCELGCALFKGVGDKPP